jgi:hypothetical protein
MVISTSDRNGAIVFFVFYEEIFVVFVSLGVNILGVSARTSTVWHSDTESWLSLAEQKLKAYVSQLHKPSTVEL